jgi:N-acetylmuramoyl-L-alanine amidase
MLKALEIQGLFLLTSHFNSVNKQQKIMQLRGRICTAAITACAILLLFSAESFPASNSEAGRKYAVAQERLADLKKSPKKRRYRSYWMDALRTFESIEKKYPSSPQAADSCFERADIYLDLYQYTKYSRDLDDASRTFGKCQSIYPRHAKAPEALYRIITIAREQKQDTASAMDTYLKMAESYPDSSWTAKAKARIGVRSTAKNGKKRKKANEVAELRAPPETVIAKPKELGTVKNVRYWSGGAYTRIVIDHDRRLKFQAHELKNPDRLVFDLQNARVDETVNKEPLPVNDGILRQVRTSQFDAETVRVVLDLASLQSYVAFPLHEPERLVIDVTGDAAEEGDGEDPVPTDPTAGPSVPLDPTASAPEPKPEPAPIAPSIARPEPDDHRDPKLSWSSQLNLKVRTIAIDAGHGGHDPGAIGKNGLKEKHVTLDIAKRLAILVKERLGVKVVMTRDSDVFIPLDERPAIAKTKGADLFVSIHVNATRKRKTRGIETYIQSLRASDKSAMATAALENATSTKTLSQLDNELTRILKDLHSDVKQEESLQLAHAVQASLVNTVKPVQGHVVNLGVKKAFFYVLINTEAPSILAEVGFISNPEEEKLLKKESYRQKIAEALFEGVKKYVEERSPQIAGI